MSPKSSNTTKTWRMESGCNVFRANMSIFEAARETPVLAECDLCVLGGSCTGLLAAIRAARLGLSGVLIERMGCFKGVATLSLVNVWHSQLDEGFEKRIFAGLTVEVMDRQRKRNAVIF